MLTVKIDEDTALNLLNERVDFWTDDVEVRQLFYKMYEKQIDEGCNESRIVEAVDDEENPNLFLVRM